MWKCVWVTGTCVVYYKLYFNGEWFNVDTHRSESGFVAWIFSTIEQNTNNRVHDSIQMHEWHGAYMAHMQSAVISYTISHVPVSLKSSHFSSAFFASFSVSSCVQYMYLYIHLQRYWVVFRFNLCFIFMFSSFFYFSVCLSVCCSFSYSFALCLCLLFGWEKNKSSVT